MYINCYMTTEIKVLWWQLWHVLLLESILVYATLYISRYDQRALAYDALCYDSITSLHQLIKHHDIYLEHTSTLTNQLYGFCFKLKRPFSHILFSNFLYYGIQELLRGPCPWIAVNGFLDFQQLTWDQMGQIKKIIINAELLVKFISISTKNINFPFAFISNSEIKYEALIYLRKIVSQKETNHMKLEFVYINSQ